MEYDNENKQITATHSTNDNSCKQRSMKEARNKVYCRVLFRSSSKPGKTLCGDRTFLYPDCGGDYMNLCVGLNFIELYSKK